MKDIKDVEKMSIEALETIAEDTRIGIPGSLRDKILDTAAAAGILEEEKRAERAGRARYAQFAIAAAAAACLMLYITVPDSPEDTFDDPLMAYAELERTFSYISSKMDRGLEIASEAAPVFEKTANVLNSPIKGN